MERGSREFPVCGGEVGVLVTNSALQSMLTHSIQSINVKICWVHPSFFFLAKRE